MITRRKFVARSAGAVAIGLAAPHVVTARAQEAIEIGPTQATEGPIGISDSVKGFRVDSLRNHSINGYWVTKKQATLAIDAFWRRPEARNALERFGNITGAQSRSISNMLITHPHTDHYGGLPTYRQAAANLRTHTSKTIRRVIKNDEHGFYANRLKDFPKDISANIPVPENGDMSDRPLSLGGLAILPKLLRGNEAIETMLLYLPDQRVLFAGDLINNQTTPVFYQGSIDNWIDQLRQLAKLYPGSTIVAPGHGKPGAFSDLISSEIDYLETFRSLIEAELTRNGGVVTKVGVRRITSSIVDKFPDWRTSAGVASRARLIALNVNWVLRGWRIAGTGASQPAQFRPTDN